MLSICRAQAESLVKVEALALALALAEAEWHRMMLGNDKDLQLELKNCQQSQRAKKDNKLY